ncbi:hypothetical protein [Paraflavitalea soli]|uniref:hypothetical protein n=1 Tax=Paraflavitalea soli TaxID=2315862 RepID=UPI0013C527C8|nr:hypothetical protein [Paraflavitalea soli]
MDTLNTIPSSLLYRCFCACAGFILVSSDYTINLIGLYPMIDSAIGYFKSLFRG